MRLRIASFDMKAKFSIPRALFPGWLAGLLAAAFLGVPLGAAELVAEYDFESVPPFLPGWGGGYGSEYKPAAAWKTPFTAALDSSNPHSGSQSVKVTYLKPAKGDKIFHSQGIELPENRGAARIRIRFFYRLTGTSGEALHFSVMGTNRRTQGKEWQDRQRVLSSLPPADSWRPVEYEGSLNADIRQIQLIWVNPSAESTGELFLDDVSVDLITPGS